MMNLHMKKGMVILLATVILVTALGGCGAGSATPSSSSAPVSTASAEPKTPIEVQTLVGMTWGSTEMNINIDAALFKTFPEMAKRFKVEWVLGGKSDGDVATKLRLALAANENACDFSQLNYTQVPEFAQADVLVDTTDAIAKYKEDILPGALNLTMYKGKSVAIPFDVKAKLWFYRKDMFDAAGIDPTKVKTLDDFIAAGKKLQAEYPKSFIWNFGASLPGYDYYQVLSGTDCSLIDDKGDYVLDTEPNVRKLLEAFKKMHDAKIVASIGSWNPDWEKAFADSTLPSELNATWMALPVFLPTYAAGQEGKWAVTQWPSFIGEVGGSEAGGSVFVIPKFGKNPDMVKEYLSNLNLSKEGNLDKFKTAQFFPMNKNAAADPAVQVADPFFGKTLAEETLKSIDSLKIFKYSPAAAQEMQIIVPYFDKAVNGEMSIDDALKAAQADLKNQIGNAYSKK